MAAKTKTKYGMLAATGLLAAILCSPALAQTVSGATDTKTEAETKAEKKAEENSTLVIVRGVRGSLNDSANKKRKSKQISDSVSAEDAGKLPDNNVVEALAHVTGIQITRKHGEGADLAIRGIQEVGTTVNGNAVGGGNLRSLNHNAENGAICTTAINFGSCQDEGPTLSDVPAALIKSVTVYKTRSADQVEGGVGGVVNVELRRPLDLNKGWTVAGSYRNSYSSIGNTQSPTSSLLVADRFDTPIGEMGWLVNLGYAKNRYQEQHLVTETVRNFYGIADLNGNEAQDYNPILFPDTALSPNYVTAYRIWNGLQKGTNSRPTANIAYQWKVNDNFDIVAEGSWLGSRESGENDYMSVITGEYWGTDGSYTNLVTADDGKTLQSFTINSTNGNVPFNMYASYWENKSDTYTTNLEGHFHKDNLQINGSLQYNWTTLTSDNISQILALKKLYSVDVSFNDAAAKGPLIELPAGVLDDVSNYNFNQLHNEVNNSTSRDFNGQIDITYHMSDDWFIRDIQTGFRLTSHFTNNYFAYRDGYVATPLSDMPLADSIQYTQLGNDAFSASGFYHLSNDAILSNWSDFIAYMNANDQWHEDWTTPVPTDKDNNSYQEKEFTRAWYGQINYGFTLGFPVDGQIGLRTTATDGQSISTWFRTTTKTDSSGNTITADRGEVVAAGHYSDAMPNVRATIHFT
ncbi:MAG TPA: TonB-dependent receptor plug domain-containing protein, partial [Asticcacaulis sp.]|nr:TonB-dependent receptor plug domain-containing protein [Asticcacaulis sp.]